MPGKDDPTPTDPLQLPALTPSTLKIRRGISLPQCSIEGCNDLPTERLPENMQAPNEIWCKAHCSMVAREIARRNYQDFIQQLRKMGVTEPPIFTEQRRERVEDRRCCVPKCTGEIVTGTEIASPFMEPGFAWVCRVHYPALDYVVKQQNGRRVVYELWTARKQKSDPERDSLKKAIRSAYASCHGKPKYIECICQGLQKARINMPARWLERWENEFHLRFEPYDWFAAYQEKRVRGTIQRHISKVSKARLRMSPK